MKTKKETKKEEKKQEWVEEFIQPNKLQIKKSKVGGYGVFAVEDIKAGEIIEEAPFVRTGYRTKDLMHPQLIQMCYPYPCSCDVCEARGRFLLLSSGYVSTYNHNENPHTELQFYLNMRFIRVTAIRNIKKGEEVFSNYGAKYSQYEEIPT